MRVAEESSVNSQTLGTLFSLKTSNTSLKSREERVVGQVVVVKAFHVCAM